MFREDIADNYEATVWEPSLVKINALTAAAEAAALILSVDETVKNPTSQIVCSFDLSLALLHSACASQAGAEAQRGGHPGLQQARGRGVPRR